MSVNKLKDFFFEDYCKRIGFVKDRSYYSMKRLRKKRLVIACKQINRTIYVNLVMLKNTINYL